MTADAGRNLVLAGLMGTGKSTLARILAGRLGREWLDTDELVVKRAGLSIPEIFARHGEEGFRALEREAVAAAAAERGRVLALGGGALLDPENTRALRATGVVVLLVGDPVVLAERAARAGVEGRPLLADAAEDVAARLGDLAEQRRAVYEAAADHVEDSTDGRGPGEVAEAIVRWVASRDGVLTDEERRAVAA